MKVLLVNTASAGGGAPIAAYRLCEALNQNGIKADLGVLSKAIDSEYVFELPRSKHYTLSRIKQKVVNKTTGCFMKSSNKYSGAGNIFSRIDVSWINNSDYDVVHLHWINSLISNKDISLINKPIVWTMHDSWLACGTEHHPNILENDTRYIEGYTRENKPITTKGIDFDRIEWNNKKKYLGNKKFSIIAPSNWEKKVADDSSLLKDKECYAIPNILPFDVFHRLDKSESRKSLGLPINKKIIGFGAARALDDPNSMKGTYYLTKAINRLKDRKDIFLLIIGPATESFTKKLDVPFSSTGFISEASDMAKCYSALDCFVNPSLIDNLPCTTYEALACGVPVVSFSGSGGQEDLIIHKKNGYLANYRDEADLLNGILFCLDDKNIDNRYIEADIQNRFNTTDIVNKHIEVYKKAIADYEMEEEIKS